jgi:EAL domain-containing protein (putative c-di-GMP-specific phosphodiesterase class I)
VGLYSLLFTDINIISQLIPFVIGPVNPDIGLSYLQSNVLIIINQLVWFVGIHPSSLIEVSKDAIFTANAAAKYSKHFLDTYAHIGGAGSTFGLIIALLFSQRNQHKQIAKYATLPAIFNINELLIFGIPIVFNRYLLVPFVIAPIATTSLARLCLELNLIHIDPSQTSWNTPALLSGYLSSRNVNGLILQLISILIAAAIYWPFLRRYDQSLKIKEERAISAMIRELCQPDINFSKLLKKQTPLGSFCRRLQRDLRSQINDQYLGMAYQPKMNRAEMLDSMEALVRWQHPSIGNIPPCIFVNIAETDDLILVLGCWINQRCMKDINIFKESGMPQIQVAINISPIQLQDKYFFQDFHDSLKKHSISPQQIELEITESQRLHLTDEILAGIKQLSSQGVSIAVDDFGMGYTSLRYLKSFNVDTIKLDGSIVSDVATSNVAQEIIRSLSSLTQSMDSKLVAEWVENEDQFKMLISLGCNQFQGAYFSMPIKREELIEFWKKQQPNK